MGRERNGEILERSKHPGLKTNLIRALQCDELKNCSNCCCVLLWHTPSFFSFSHFSLPKSNESRENFVSEPPTIMDPNLGRIATTPSIQNENKLIVEWWEKERAKYRLTSGRENVCNTLRGKCKNSKTWGSQVLIFVTLVDAQLLQLYFSIF